MCHKGYLILRIVVSLTVFVSYGKSELVDFVNGHTNNIQISFFPLSFEKCIEKCKQRSFCDAIKYDRFSHLCELVKEHEILTENNRSTVRRVVTSLKTSWRMVSHTIIHNIIQLHRSTLISYNFDKKCTYNVTTRLTLVILWLLNILMLNHLKIINRK